MSFMKRPSILFIILVHGAFGMSGSGGAQPYGSGPGAGAGGLIGQAIDGYKDAKGAITGHSAEADQLRMNLSLLAAQVLSLGNANPAQLVSADNARDKSAALDAVVGIIGQGPVAASQDLAVIKGSIAVVPGLQFLFTPQGPNRISIWDAYFSPPIMAAIISAKANVIVAFLNYISQNVDKLTPTQISSLNQSIPVLTNRLQIGSRL